MTSPYADPMYLEDDGFYHKGGETYFRWELEPPEELAAVAEVIDDEWEYTLDGDWNMIRECPLCGRQESGLLQPSHYCEETA
jgi:hypothetical protein